MQVKDLLDFLEEEGMSDFVSVVKESEYSKQKLMKFQNEFRITSDIFYDLYIAGYLNNILSPSIIDEWAYNYEMFLKANGNINDLLNYKKEKEDGDAYPSSFLLH